MYLKLGKQKLGRVCRNTVRLRVFKDRKRDKVEGSEITRQNNTVKLGQKAQSEKTEIISIVMG